MSKRNSVFILFSAFAILGCAPGLFSTKAPWSYDTEEGPNGRLIAMDTSRNWDLRVQAFQRLVSDELRGEPVGNEDWVESWPDTWSEYWPWYFDRLRADQVNAEKYIAFAIELRERAGLPAVRLTNKRSSQPDI